MKASRLFFLLIFPFLFTGTHLNPLPAAQAQETWTQQSSGTTKLLAAVVFCNNRFFAVGPGIILTSLDGKSWLPIEAVDDLNFWHIFCLRQFMIAVGFYGTISTSTDGIHWTNQTSGTTNGLWGVAAGDVDSDGRDEIVTAGSGGTILFSSGGSPWLADSSGVSTSLNAATFAGSQFVVVGNAGVILTSPNGETWTKRDSGTTTTLLDLHPWGSVVFPIGIVGFAGTWLSSRDGINWFNKNTGTTNTLQGVVYGNGKFVVVGDGGTILSSADGGDTWTDRSPGGIPSLRGVTFGTPERSAASRSSLFVAVGDEGTILTSEVPTSPTPTPTPEPIPVIGAGGFSILALVMGFLLMKFLFKRHAPPRILQERGKSTRG